MTATNDTYQRITDMVVEQLEAGTKPWIRPWVGTGRAGAIMPRRANGEQYRGINVLMLWIASQMIGYQQNVWMTYRQALALGGQVRKGEKGSLVVKYGTFTPKEQDASDGDEDREVPYLRGYTVFNVEQIDNLPETYFTACEPVPDKVVPHLEIVERFVASTGAIITYGGTRACYRVSSDDILMPDRSRFIDETHLYSVLLHEMGHWSGRPDRTNRDLTVRFGSAGHALEEAVAELTSAFLCADLGIPHNPRDNTAAYIDSWLALLKKEKKAVFTAAAKAQSAADYLHSLQPSDIRVAA
ncbi:ArdC family protein [Notoacmeibacter sp. MSK16QG-6]|uniref:ArdC family protein n=1 Tax=Notoacmeibacter sp. MSK16QG-6 TaxID=2957982 RepID=UPI00209E03BD|nr:zincin-like metallopeptidase domain-containing protein [Notoacmeibacter sp. MSK16QG-6]MCP1201063.1 zincin-like metallopeptidase domain-containing protein [Notoacmeibacter sp. MSK16QG-6]